MGSTARRALMITASFVLLAAGCPDEDDTETTEAPVATGAPLETDTPADPAVTGAPVATEAPAATGAPLETEPPADIGAPAATDAPADTDPPVATEVVGSPEPTAIDALFEYGIDNADGQFIETDTAAAAVEVGGVTIEVGDRAKLTTTVTAPDASPLHRVTVYAVTEDGDNLNFTCESISDGDGGTVERNGARLFRDGTTPIEQAPPGCDPADPFSIVMPLACVGGTLSAFVVDEIGGDLVLPAADEFVLEIASGDIDDGSSAVYALGLSSSAVCVG